MTIRVLRKIEIQKYMKCIIENITTYFSYNLIIDTYEGLIGIFCTYI